MVAKKKKDRSQPETPVKRPPPPPLPEMEYSERMQVAATKYFAVLQFLARHGPGAPVDHLMLLLDRSRPAVVAALEKLEHDGMVERTALDGCETRKRTKQIWGITAAGLRDPFVMGGGPAFKGVTRKTLHELGVQRVYLYARAAGWSEWTLARNLMLREANGRLIPTAKLPDAIGLPPPPEPRTAIEFERTPKNWKLYLKIFAMHVKCIAAGKYGHVVYLSEDGKHDTVRKNFMKAVEWLYAREWRTVTDFRHCFTFADLDEWGQSLVGEGAATSAKR